MSATREFSWRRIFGFIRRNHLYSCWKFRGPFNQCAGRKHIQEMSSFQYEWSQSSSFWTSKSCRCKCCKGFSEIQYIMEVRRSGVGAGKGNRFYYSTFIYIAPFIQSSLSILKFISILYWLYCIKYIVLYLYILIHSEDLSKTFQVISNFH